MSHFDSCQADGESSDEKTVSDLDDLGMSEELSQSEDEGNEENLKRYSK